MAILGEAVLDQDGVLHGWCFSPDEPGRRRTVEILIDEDVAATVIASRFREDLRNGQFGDGYCGFMLSLATPIAQAPQAAMLRARDLISGICFWQKRLGDYAVPAVFDERVEQVRASLRQRATSPAFLGGASRATALASGLGMLGEQLAARGGAPQRRGFTLPAPAKPRVSVIFDAGADGAALEALRMAAPALAEALAEAILTDDGSDKRLITQQAQVRNLGYLYAGGQKPAARRNLAAAAARGERLVFLHPAEPGAGSALLGLPDVVVLAGGIADAARRVAPSLMEAIEELDGPAWPGFILSAPRGMGEFDVTVDDGAGLDVIDWVLRAARDGAAMKVWRCPWAGMPSATPTDIPAGHRFAERWIFK
jgi:hypothetical protein